MEPDPGLDAHYTYGMQAAEEPEVFVGLVRQQIFEEASLGILPTRTSASSVCSCVGVPDRSPFL